MGLLQPTADKLEIGLQSAKCKIVKIKKKMKQKKEKVKNGGLFNSLSKYGFLRFFNFRKG